MARLDVVIPVRNEEKHIEKLLDRVNKSLSVKEIDFEIIVVVDPSTDNTLGLLHSLQDKYPLVIMEKQGKPGKGYSLIEGFRSSKAEFMAFIDADLQYPPEKIPEMLKKLQSDDYGVITANRVSYAGSKSRSIGSFLNKVIIGKLLLGFNVDIQSGLKVFRSNVFKHLDTRDVTPWTFDIPLLYTARELGYKLGQVDINFSPREEGSSNVSYIKTAWAIIKNALKIYLKESKTYHHGIGAHENGPHITYRGKRYSTHSDLHHSKSSIYTFTRTQNATLMIIFFVVLTCLLAWPLQTGITLIAILSAIYFFDVLFTLYLTLKSLHFPPEIEISAEELNKLEDSTLPIYSILCPLYKEASVVGQFVEGMKKINWPQNKLDVLLLLEENDQETIDAANALNLPEFVRVVVVPHSMPKTKPKACNYGLHHAKGDYIVIYDAEDQPDPDQLKKTYLAFKQSSEKTVCIQAKLNYYNTNQNMLTKLFTAEYSLWFDVILPGLQSINTIIPLGGTSNHFKTKELVSLGGWDAFNVTEDCDLGVRLFSEGYKTAIVNSTTLEEANSNLKNWIRQRSRWIKGYLQTYLVHMREPWKFSKRHKHHSLLFQLIIGLRITFILINPILWITTIAYFTLNQYVGSAIEALYPTVVFYMAAIALVFGNFLYIYNYMIGLAKREKWSVIKYVFLVPIYWAFMSVSAVIAFYQLITKPHYWEKTHHGLHKNKKDKTKGKKLFIEAKANIKKSITPTVFSGGILIASTMTANIANFIYNAYLGREVDLAQFGTVSLISNIFAIAAVFSNALGKATAYKVAFVSGKFKVIIKDFYNYIQKFTWVFSLITTAIWVLMAPVLAKFFNESDITPFLLFTPYWMTSFVGSVNSGFLSGAHKFSLLGYSVLIESISKVLLAVLMIETGKPQLIYVVIPLSVFLSFVFETIAVYYTKSEKVKEKIDLSFPVGFYFTSILTKVSSVIFLSADVILAKHFLTPEDAGKYALLSLSGKIVYFLGSLFSPFITPVIGKEEGDGVNSKLTFYKLLAGNSLLSFVGFLGIGVLGKYTVPLLFGDKATVIIPYLTSYTFAMFVFGVSFAFVAYHQAKKQYSFTVLPLIFAVTQVALISANITHDVKTFVNIIVTLSYLQLISIVILHIMYPTLLLQSKKIFKQKIHNLENKKQLNILIFNWRDNKHIWAGGAEVYVHELAKEWVLMGHNVTLFCGNDRKCKTRETIDGVQIIRRGGFFTVYIWAVIYYLLSLRHKCDVIVDSENGIPFFTPIYSRKPVTLLIHHVHKDIVLNELKLPKYLLPIAFIAKHLESWLMPIIYSRSKIVAVSESTKSDLRQIGFKKSIFVVNPGVEKGKFKRIEKSKNPSILYLGRMKFYKSLETLLKAHVEIIESYPDAKLIFAGFGEATQSLEKLASELHIKDKVEFLGKVTEKKKIKLLGEAWVFSCPSSMEGWGITVIEASASGTAVVASDVPGLRDSVKNPSTGFLVEKGNESAFAKAILKIISNPKLRNEFENEGVKWASNFTWDKGAEKFINIWNYSSLKKETATNKYTLEFKGKSVYGEI